MAVPRQHARPGARARLALLCALAAVAPPGAVTQFCPYLENPGQVYSAEDVQVNLQQAWINSPSMKPERKHIVGRLWHGDCPGTARICGSCIGQEIPMNGNNFDGKDQIRVEYSVMFGRLFLAEGYLSCNPILNSATFDVKAEREESSFVFVDEYDVVNCTLQYLTFRGMRYSNKMKQLNEFGIQPRVRIQIGPPRVGPTATGINFNYAIESTTFIVMDEVNTMPNLETCPTMGIESQRGTARYPREQYNTEVVASAERQNLLYWDPSSGGNRCLQTRLPRAERFLFPAPQPNGYQKPRMNGGALAGLHTAVTGDPVAPMRIQPLFCQTEDVRILDPPFCAALESDGHTACAADPMSYVYHIEDYEDAVLKVNGVRLWDKDIWTGHLDTTFSFKFRTELAGGVKKANDPFDHEVDDGGLNIQDGSGIFGFYCPRPYYDSKKRASQFETGVDSNNQAWNKYCAQTLNDAISGVIILTKQQTKFYVLPSTDRTPSTDFDQTNCQMTRCVPLEGCDPLAEKELPENKWQCSSVSDMVGETACMVGSGPSKKVCERKEVTPGTGVFRCICKSKVYQRSVHQGKTAWSMVLFWEVADRDNRSKVFETGYMDITYTNQSVVDGTMWADPQVLAYYSAYTGGAGPFDWFRVSPLKLKGAVSTNVDVTTFTVDASSKTIHNPRFQVTLETKYGNLSLPNMKNLALSTPANLSRTRIFFEGTIDQVNEAVNVIEYRVPGPLYPHFHTLSLQHSIYGHVDERLTLTIDDLGNAGRPSKWGTVTSMEFNLVVVADNDGPEVSGPASYHDKENGWFALSGLSVVDVDAKDRLRPNETLVGPGRIHIIDLQLLFESGFGKFRFDTNATRRLHLKTPVPGSLRPVPGEPEPCVAQCGRAMVLATYKQFLSVDSKHCRDCLENYAKSRVATVGNRVVHFEGDLEDCKFALGRTFYKGDPGFNTNSPSTGDPFTDLGKQTPSFGDPKAQEKVSITAMDNGNAGCTSEESKKSVLQASVRLDPVEDSPFLLFYQDGMDMCERCKDAGTCSIYCPGGSPTVYLFESTSFTFNQSFSVQIRDPDHRDTEFGPVVYKLNFKVAQGTLLLSDTTIVNGQSEAITGLSFSIGSQACVDCKEFEISGSMYELNKVLMGITYTPIKYYNSRFGSPEYLIVSVTQMAPVKLAQSTLTVELYAQEVNDNPELNLYVDPKKGTQLPISGKFYDFILLGGSIDRSKYCGGDAASCFLMRDVDSCESMYNAKGIRPAAADTVAVIQGTAPGCLDTSMSAGRIRMVAECMYGNLWFFTFSEIREWESKGNQWPPDLTLVPAQDPGKSQRLVITNHHLSQYAGGILRYYASTDSARPDAITLEFDDQGNTGRETPGDPMFCCCGNKACDKCVPAAGGGMGGNGCRYELDVSSCAKVPGWVCTDAEQGSKGIPGWAVTVIICVASALAVGGFAKIVYHGSATNPLNLLLREEVNAVSDPTEDKKKMSIAKYVQDNSMKDEVSLAVAV